MIRLDPQQTKKTFELGGGVEVTCLPVTTAIWNSSGAEAYLAAVEAGDAEDAVQQGIRVMKAVGRKVIVAWNGLGDPDGNPVDPSPEWIDLMMDVQPLYEAFRDKVVASYIILRAEGNGSAASPTGSGKAASGTAPNATMSAKIARSGSTNRKRSRAPKSGT